MADLGIYTKNADIVKKAGLYANVSGSEVAFTDTIVLLNESIINDMTGYNWSDAFSTLDVDTKGILTDTGACMCAMDIINYDMLSYNSMSEAQTMLNYLDSKITRNIQVLKDKNTTQQFVINGGI